jgi:hypothetical protein
MTKVRFPVGVMTGLCSLHHSVQTGCGAHPAPYTMGSGASSYAGCKAAGA